MSAAAEDGGIRLRGFALSENDYAEFTVFAETRWRFARRKYVMRRLTMFSVGPVAVGLAAGLRLYPGLTERAGGLSGLVVLAAVLSLALGGGSWLLRPSLIRRSARHRFRDGTFDAYRQPMRVEIAPTGLRVESGVGSWEAPWPTIVDIAEGDAGLYLFCNSLQALILPRRVFADTGELEEILSLSCRWRAQAGDDRGTTDAAS